jgi:hypothetical protein
VPATAEPYCIFAWFAFAKVMNSCRFFVGKSLRDQYARLGDQRDRSKVGHRVVERNGVECLSRKNAAGAEQELISVGRGLRHPGGAGYAPRAADIFEDHRLDQ